MYPYKVLYIESTQVHKKWVKNPLVDGVTVSQELEALLVEQDKKGYELVEITPLVGTRDYLSGVTTPITTGLLVTFKKKDL